jgi:replicative DNA helicase
MELPCDPEAERTVLGALLVNPWILPDLELIEVDFYVERHRIIFRVIEGLCKSNCPVDPVTVSDNFSDSQLRYVGGMPYIIRLLVLCPAPSIKAHNTARIIREYRLRRDLLQRAQRLANLALDLNAPLPDFNTPVGAK